MVAFFKKRISIVVFLIVIVLIINIPGVNNTFGVKAIRSGVLLAFYPFQVVFHYTISSVDGFFRGIFTLSSAQKDNELLKKELGNLKLKLYNLTEVQKENQILTQFLEHKKTLSSYDTVLVPVIGRDPTNWFDSILVNIGRLKGIKVGMPVLTYDGAVGYVIEVNPYTSKIRLLTDSNCSVSGVDQNSGDIGLIVGTRYNRLTMKYIPLQANVSVGDTITTSNISDIFPKGIPIGVISKVEKNDYELFQHLEVTPYVSFSRLQWVIIIR